jgi:hypothetical protein
MGLIGSAVFVLLGQLLSGCNLRDLILDGNRSWHLDMMYSL